MRTHKELWQMIEPLVIEEGLTLYDIERGSGGGGKGRSIIRIFLSNDKDVSKSTDVSNNGELQVGEEQGSEDRDNGVSLEHCAKISRKISALDRFEEIIPEYTTLEVSSPGINRSLRLPWHFAAAVGEHIFLKGILHSTNLNIENKLDDKQQEEGSKERVVRGILKSFDGQCGIVEEDKTGQNLQFDCNEIASARVDFLF
jgi:ribosome maturation factor RimP